MSLLTNNWSDILDELLKSIVYTNNQRANFKLYIAIERLGQAKEQWRNLKERHMKIRDYQKRGLEVMLDTKTYVNYDGYKIDQIGRVIYEKRRQ